MRLPKTSPLLAGLCLVLAAGGALAQTNPQIPGEQRAPFSTRAPVLQEPFYNPSNAPLPGVSPQAPASPQYYNPTPLPGTPTPPAPMFQR